MGASLYWESVEKQSLCCDKGILSYVFSTRKTSLVIKIRAQRKNYTVAEDQSKSHLQPMPFPYFSFFFPKFLFARGHWYHFLPQK